MGRIREAIRRTVALRYDPGRSAAPTVTATGRGFVADEILRVARASGVSIVEDRDLVELLGRLDPGEAIPPELYVVVAEMLAYLYRMNRHTLSELALGAQVPPTEREPGADQLVPPAGSSPLPPRGG